LRRALAPHGRNHEQQKSRAQEDAAGKIQEANSGRHAAFSMAPAVKNAPIQTMFLRFNKSAAPFEPNRAIGGIFQQ
jgi:hypothetical protein